MGCFLPSQVSLCPGNGSAVGWFSPVRSQRREREFFTFVPRVLTYTPVGHSGRELKKSAKRAQGPHNKGLLAVSICCIKLCVLCSVAVCLESTARGQLCHLPVIKNAFLTGADRAPIEGDLISITW